jgi:anti-sigma regulatory factor (Ser/Thr protein kinase)
MPDGDIHLAVVDVMGKGVAATKSALAVTHALRLLALDGCTMDRLVARAGALVNSQSPDLVATVLVARYRPADGVVQLAGGGHPPALVVPAEGEVRLVSAPGVPIGWPGAGSTEVVSVTLGRRDALVLYTDGLIEATKDVLVGLDGLTAAAAQTSPYPAHHLARALVERALSGAERRDDSLALVLRRRTPPPPGSMAPLSPFEYRFSPTPATIPLSRHLLADWLEHLDLDDGERADLLLVASELCSNAVRHASGLPGSLFLRAWAEGDAVVVEVEDDGSGFEPTVFYDDDLPDPEAEQGRGLYVVEALADELSVSRSDDHTVVRAVRRAVLPDGR